MASCVRLSAIATRIDCIGNNYDHKIVLLKTIFMCILYIRCFSYNLVHIYIIILLKLNLRTLKNSRLYTR